jgi:hypothetical protein
MFCRRPELTATSALFLFHPVANVVDRHLRHADTGLVGLTLDGIHQPALGGIGRHFDYLRARRHLRHPLRDQEGDERAAEAEYGRHQQQALQVQPGVLRQHTVDTEHLHRNAEDGQHGEVGDDQQKNPFHWSIASG